MKDEDRNLYVPQLTKTYERMNKKQLQAKKKGGKEISEYFESLVKEPVQQATKAQIEPDVTLPTPSPPTDSGSSKQEP